MYFPSLNIGIEEEYQIIDPQSRELVGYVTQSMAREKMVVNERVPGQEYAERLREGYVEAGTPVCVDISEARSALLRVRTNLLELANANGVKVVGAGTHPFSRWEGSDDSAAQYRQLAEDAQMATGQCSSTRCPVPGFPATSAPTKITGATSTRCCARTRSRMHAG